MGETPRTRFERTLKTMNQKGHFQSALLATMDGLPIASAPSSYDAESSIEMVTLVKQVVNRVYHQLRLAKVDEVSLVSRDGEKMVCRYFAHDGEEFILAIVAPPDQCYRRVTSKAIHDIRDVLSGKGRVGVSV